MIFHDLIIFGDISLLYRFKLELEVRNGPFISSFNIIIEMEILRSNMKRVHKFMSMYTRIIKKCLFLIFETLLIFFY